MIPVFGLSIPFLFVLLILLLTKTPKLGVWVVGGLIVTVAFGLLILLPIAVHDGIVPTPAGAKAPLLGLTVPFLFVLLVILLNKAPKMGAGVIVSVLLMGVFGAVLWLSSSHPRVVRTQSIEGPGGRMSIGQQTQSNSGIAVVDRNVDRVYENVMRAPSGSVISSPPVPVMPATVDELSPIWSEGVENEYEADIYPSQLAAARALGRRMADSIRKLVGDPNGRTVTEVVLFQEGNDRDIVMEFERTLAEETPRMQYSVEADLRGVESEEIAVTLRLEKIVPTLKYLVPGPEGPHVVKRPAPGATESGRIVVTAFTNDKRASAEANFVTKLWVEDFSGFANGRPADQFIVARSWETCTSENEAKNQAIRDACNRVSAIIGRTWETVPGRAPLTIDATDILEGGLIVDQFVQSFDGMAGRLWRQALLVDASAEKLGWLESRKSRAMHVERVTWAGMILSGLGVLVVIIATYLFLNMATRGYYVWSLRIAGTVLAIAGIVSIILVLR